jgi:hypothetical protein
MSSPSPDDAISDVSADSEGALEVLLRLAASAQAFRSADGRFYARVPVGDRHEVHGLKSTALRDWLIDGYLTEQGVLPTDWTIRRVLDTLEAYARVEGGSSSVFIRIGRDHAVDDDSSTYLDLGDPSGRAIKIDAEGWSVVNRPDVHCVRRWIRPKHLLDVSLLVSPVMKNRVVAEETQEVEQLDPDCLLLRLIVGPE